MIKSFRMKIDQCVHTKKKLIEAGLKLSKQEEKIKKLKESNDTTK